MIKSAVDLCCTILQAVSKKLLDLLHTLLILCPTAQMHCALFWPHPHWILPLNKPLATPTGTDRSRYTPILAPSTYISDYSSWSSDTAEASKWLLAAGEATGKSVEAAPQGNISAAATSEGSPSGPLGGSIVDMSTAGPTTCTGNAQIYDHFQPNQSQHISLLKTQLSEGERMVINDITVITNGIMEDYFAILSCR